MGKKRRRTAKEARQSGAEVASPGGPTLKWLSPKDAPFHVAGFAWFESDKLYRRLPIMTKHLLPPKVDRLANCTAGGQVRFRTDSACLSLRVRLTGPADMSHMPATGQCGFDCYIGPAGRQRYCSTAKCPPGESSYECQMFQFPLRRMRDVTLNFPLYRGVEELQVGLETAAEVRQPRPYQSNLRAVFYGTSITQGGCASRPGMAYTNILSRRFDIEFINLGFSGAGRGEPEVARQIAEVPGPACFVLDYEANAHALGQLKRTLPAFIRILRDAHPRVPILTVSRIPTAAERFNTAVRRGRLERREFQRQTIQTLRRRGDRLVYFQDGSALLGADRDECTVDGSHPTDLGFMRMANALAPMVDKILSRTRPPHS